MEKEKPFSWIRWLLQGALLVVALVAVIVSIRSLRDPGQKLNIEEIFEESEAVWDWCPAGSEVQIESLLPGKASITSTDVCEVETRPVQVQQTEGADWKPLLRAKSPGSPEILLEGDLERGIFRTQGLPFFAPKLRAYLQGLSSP